MARSDLRWKFPQSEILRIEMTFIILIALAVFILVLFEFSFTLALGLALLFVGLYLLVAKGTKSFHAVEEHYKVGATHLEVTRKGRGHITHEKLPLRQIHHHKLDKFFLGGYVVSREGKKYLLFFNNRGEMDQFERHLQKHLKAAR